MTRQGVKVFCICSFLVAALPVFLLLQGCGNNGGSQTVTSKLQSGSSNPTAPAGVPGAVPVAPSLLVAQAAAYSQINLTWKDNSTTETGFKVERANAVAGPFVTGPGTFSVINTTVPNATGYVDATVLASTGYLYRISSTNAAGDSAVTANVSITTPAAPTTPPLAPTGLVATPSAPTMVTLAWNDNSNNESGFKVERSADNGVTYKAIVFMSANATTYTDYNLNPVTAYIYHVRSSNVAGDSLNTANISATTPAAGNMATFSYISLNILGPNCVTCHGPSLAFSGIRYDSYNATLGTVSKGSASGSALYSSIINNRMPPGSPLSATQASAIANWINGGALNN